MKQLSKYSSHTLTDLYGDVMVSWRKNVAIQGFTFGMLNKVTGFPVVTGSVSGFITINGGSQAALTKAGRVMAGSRAFRTAASAR